jgi:hypothetical protein
MFLQTLSFGAQNRLHLQQNEKEAWSEMYSLYYCNQYQVSLRLYVRGVGIK